MLPRNKQIRSDKTGLDPKFPPNLVISKILNAPQISLLSLVFFQPTRSKGLNLRGADYLWLSSASEAQCFLIARCQNTTHKTVDQSWAVFTSQHLCFRPGFKKVKSNAPGMLFVMQKFWLFNKQQQQELHRDTTNELYSLLSRMVLTSRRCIRHVLDLCCYYFDIVK